MDVPTGLGKNRDGGAGLGIAEPGVRGLKRYWLYEAGSIPDDSRAGRTAESSDPWSVEITICDFKKELADGEMR